MGDMRDDDTGGTVSPQPPEIPEWAAETLLAGGSQARIVLNGQPYVLRLTRAGKLILTK